MSRLLLAAEVPAGGAFDKRHADAPAGLFSWFGQSLERFYQHIVLPHNSATVSYHSAHKGQIKVEFFCRNDFRRQNAALQPHRRREARAPLSQPRSFR